MTVALVANIARPISSAISTAFSSDSHGALSSYGLLGAAASPDAVITALFASGEEGAWYDPSDFSTMFQDSVGTTPVTAVGQNVGLILDKSKGLVLGPELVTNGTFDTNTDGWTPATATLSVVSNTMQVEWLSGVAFARQIVTTVIGKTYRFTVDCIKGTSSGFLVYVGPSAGTFTYANISGSINKTYTYYFTATSTTCYVQCYCGTNSAGNNSRYDNITCKEIAGNHATQATSASRPVLQIAGNGKYYRDFDAVDDSMGTTFPSSLGSSCTVARSDPTTGAVILTAQTIGTSYSATADDCALIIVNRALTSQETTNVTAWLNAKAGI